MPLPPIAHNATPRYRLGYVARGIQHSIVVHMTTGTTSGDAVTYGTALANLLKPMCATDTVFQSIDYAAAGSDVFNSAATLSIAGTNATASSDVGRAVYVNFVGRNPNGRKTRIFLYPGIQFNDSSYRITSAEYAPVGTVVTGLNSGTGGVMCADGAAPVWKGYANVGYNDRYVKRIRRTG